MKKIRIGKDIHITWEIAVENGFQSSVEEWLQSLIQPAEDVTDTVCQSI